MQEQPLEDEQLQDSQGDPDVLAALKQEVEGEKEEQDGEGHGGKQEEGQEIELYDVACTGFPLPPGYKVKFCIKEDVAREKFVTSVVDDPTLTLNREEATKIFYKMVELEKELGLELGPIDLKAQLALGHGTEGEKEEKEDDNEEEKEEKEEKEDDNEEEKEEKEEKEDDNEEEKEEKEEKEDDNEEEKEEKEEKEDDNEEEKEDNNEEEKEEEKYDGPQSSRVEPWIEKMYEEWDSSEDSTVIPSWAASSQDLEEKLANTAPEDYMNVAAMHEIKAEKKARREAKQVKGNDDEKAGSDGFTWSPLTKKGFNDFILYCQGVKPTVEPCMQLPYQRPTLEVFKEKVIKWKPITKGGLRKFMAGFGRQAPDPFASVAEMALGDFVELSIAADVDNLPKTIAPEIAKSIAYVSELYHKWGVADYEDIEWWLHAEWGPLLVVFLHALSFSLLRSCEE